MHRPPFPPGVAASRRQRHPCFTTIALPANACSSRSSAAAAASSPSPRHRPAPLNMVAANPLPPSTRSNISRTKPPATTAPSAPSPSPSPSTTTTAAAAAAAAVAAANTATTNTATKTKKRLPASLPSQDSARARNASAITSPSTRTSSSTTAVRSKAAMTPTSHTTGISGHLGVCDARFALPVPDALPHEIEPARRGRNAQRRARYAEHFRRYLYLRRLLKPWSEAFRVRHGRTPSLVDVHDAEVPGLFDRFVEYLEALDGLRVDG